MKAEILNDFDVYRSNRKEKLNVETLQSKIAELDKAKKNILWLLDNPNGSADMHGLSYWAKVVEDLVKEIKENL